MIPENEVGVIILFAQQAELADFEIVSAKSAFPDAIVEKNGQEYKVEFEYKASNFLAHGHDIRAVDLIICWENDYVDSILPVLALSEDNWSQTSLDLPTHLLREATYWKQRALLAEQRLETSQHEIKTMRISMKSGRFPIRDRLEELGDTAIQILQILAANPRQRPKEVAEMLDVTRQTVGYHISRLETLGLIERNGRAVQLLVDMPDDWQ